MRFGSQILESFEQTTDNSKPHDMDTNLILANDQAAINAIRAAGAHQL
jgi:hypothetical protein